jgi:hypothetical protein
VLISIGIGYQHRIQRDYAASWISQRDFSWQLQARAPGLVPNTAIVSNRVIARYAGSWADVSAVNQLYDPGMTGDQNAYWYYTVGEISMKKVRDENYSLEGNKKILKFDGDLKESIVLMTPSASQCLWVLESIDAHNPYVDNALRPLVRFSNIERIVPASSNKNYSRIWGAPPPEDWCSYYQQAKFARQQHDWAGVIRLFEQAQEKNFAPRHPVEYAPVIEAYAMQGQWQQASQLTEIARKPVGSATLPLEEYLCAIWQRVQHQAGDPPEARTVMQSLDCE